jgi:uncharacterized membrane protein
MNVSSTIQWATPYSLGPLLAFVVAAVAAFALLRWATGRPIAPARRAGLLVIRLAILAILALIVINPVRVDETPGTTERPKVFYLLDASQSMAIGKGETRWEQSVRSFREADRARDLRFGAQVSLFRFGSRLAALDADFLHQKANAPTQGGGSGAALAAEPQRREEPLPAPTDADTLLGASLEGLTNQFGQAPPQAMVVFSDGRARDAERADVMARAYGRMKIPIHVLPAGEPDVGGDIAIVSLVAPTQVRKSSKVAVHVFVRSFGYKGRRGDLKIVAAAAPGKPEALLAHTPVVLEDGLKSYTLSFASGEQDRHIEARIAPQPGEVSAWNNVFGADMAIDHTKIRVLYLEGATEQYLVQAVRSLLGRDTVRGAYASLQEALLEDRDVDCTAVAAAGSGGDFAMPTRTDNGGPGFPEIASELFAYDVIILSNVPTETLDAKHQAWIEEWVSRRGGGLLMVGGPNSFASGRWNGTPIAKMLPVELSPAADWAESPISVTPVTSGAIHPIWQITADEAQNRALLPTLPRFFGSNRVGGAKPVALVLAHGEKSVSRGEPLPEIAVQNYGRGRTMAMTPAVTRRWAAEFTQSWGGPDARYYKKFWRNVVYWLSENSSTGRRRLLAETDKRLYRPGEPIVLRAQAFDEDASPTLEYRVAVTVEPKSSDPITSDSSPLRRPSATDGPPSEAAQAPYLPWSEEFALRGQPAEKLYAATLPIADAKSVPAGATLTQGLRFELTAYEHNTQVDSSSLEVQILDDPTEQQNPLPDHDLLRRIANDSGGTVLNGPKDLSAMIERLPRITGPPEVKKTPAWSGSWLLSMLIGLLTVEWFWRRGLGLA